MNNKISLIIPTKNEVESLNEVLSEVSNYKIIDEIIIVVDDKEDNSIPVANKHNCKIIIQKNKGYGSAIIEGFKNCKNYFGCIFNADMSFDPKYLEHMIKLSKNYNFIFGTRYKDDGGSDDDDIVTYTGNHIFSFISNKILRIKLSDILYTYVLCEVKKFNALGLTNSDFRLCVELPVKVKFKNYSYSEIPMFERKRFGGKKKVNAIRDGSLILIEILKSFKFFF